jgi:hypothetical protein
MLFLRSFNLIERRNSMPSSAFSGETTFGEFGLFKKWLVQPEPPSTLAPIPSLGQAWSKCVTSFQTRERV